MVKVTEKQKEQFRRLHEKGFSYCRISKKMKVPVSTVIYWVNPKYRQKMQKRSRENRRNPRYKKWLRNYTKKYHSQRRRTDPEFRRMKDESVKKYREKLKKYKPLSLSPEILIELKKLYNNEGLPPSKVAVKTAENFFPSFISKEKPNHVDSRLMKTVILLCARWRAQRPEVKKKAVEIKKLYNRRSEVRKRSNMYINEYIKRRYREEPEFRKRILERAKKYYARKHDRNKVV